MTDARMIVVGYLAGTIGAALLAVGWARRRRPVRCVQCGDARCKGGAWCKYWPRDWGGL